MRLGLEEPEGAEYPLDGQRSGGFQVNPLGRDAPIIGQQEERAVGVEGDAAVDEAAALTLPNEEAVTPLGNGLSRGLDGEHVDGAPPWEPVLESVGVEGNAGRHRAQIVAVGAGEELAMDGEGVGV